MIKKQAQDVINDNMLEYSAFVLTQRALPDLRDGMKPVHRRILYSMKLNNTTKLTKSATVSGRIMEVHPHGDTYPAIVNLVQKDRQNIPFLVGKGSWGQFTSNRQGAASSRYTEVKLDRPALEVMKELKNKSVNYVPNYDGTIMMPEVLPVTYPTILTQANSGIGVGFASDTLSYNIHEIRDLIKKYLDTEVMDDILIPDFSTGAFIVDNENNMKEIQSIMETGQGSFLMRAKATIEDNKIIVTEVPYGVRREQIIDRIIKLNKDKKLPEVTDVRDGTSFTGMKIVITLRKNAKPQEVLQKLYLMTPMQANVSANMNMLVEGYPVVLGVKDTLVRWIEWRKSVIIKGLENDIANMEKELHLLNGMKKILLDIDKAVEIIRHSKNDVSAIKQLCDHFKIDDIQAKHVANIRLINLNESKIKTQLLEIEGLERKWHLLKGDVKSKDFINKHLIESMDTSIKVMEAPKRKTKMLKVSQAAKKVIKSIQKASNKVEDYPCNVMITKKGYLFKDKGNDEQSLNNFKKKVRLGDEISRTITTQNDKIVCVFLKNGRMGRIKVNDIHLEDGMFIPNELKEDILDISYIFEAKENSLITLGFADGQMVRIPAEGYDRLRRILVSAYRIEADLIFIRESALDDDKKVVVSQGNRKKTVAINEIVIKKSLVASGRNYLRQVDNGEKILIELVD